MSLLTEFYRERESLRRRVRRLAAQPGGLALDVGCKKADLSASLAVPFRRLIGVDKILQEEWRSTPPGVDCLQADAAALPFRKESFDAVVACESLQYLQHPLEAVAEFHRVLKPGGQLVLSFPEGNAINRFLEPYNLTRRVKAALRPDVPLQDFTFHHRARDLLEACGNGWECRSWDRRGSLLFIYAAWVLEIVHALYSRWRDRGLLRRALARGLLRPLVHCLFGVMRADFALPLGGLAYNNVLLLKKT